VKRLVSRGDLNSPWGLALAPGGFAPFSGKLLVGNFGDGLIHGYGRFSGRPKDTLLDEQGQPIQIDDRWALRFGTDTTGGEHTLLFSAGINDENPRSRSPSPRAPLAPESPRSALAWTLRSAEPGIESQSVISTGRSKAPIVTSAPEGHPAPRRLWSVSRLCSRRSGRMRR
jgi:hypothetical protein